VGITVARIGVLPDRAYSWDQIHTDPTLAFRPVDSLRPAQARRYWLRLTIHNPSRYAGAAQLTVLPNLDNTLYYFDEDARAWRTRRAGAAVGIYPGRLRGELPLLLPGGATTTCYVRLTLPAYTALPPACAMWVRVAPETAVQAHFLFLTVTWAVSVAVLGLLGLFSLYAYVRFRDRILLYQVMLQLGGILYLTRYRGFFHLLLPQPVFSLRLLPDGHGYSYTPDGLLVHLSVVLLLLGASLATRAYLHTATHLPRLDTALRYGTWGYAGFSFVVALVNVSGHYVELTTIVFDNVLVAGVLGLLLVTALTAYRRRLPAARAYLLASAGPMGCALALALYHVLVTGVEYGNLLLPDLAIVSHAVGFSLALGTRLYQLQQTLLAREQEARELALDIGQHALRHREIVLQNSHIQAALRAMQQRQQAHEQQARQLSADVQQHEAANQDLQAQLEANQRELASTSLYVQQKNALLAELKQQIQALPHLGPGQPRELAGVQSLLQSSQYLDEDWARFKRHFEQVHPRFFEELQAKYPALTRHEQRLYCYFHLQLSAKEIAALLNIDPDSVRRAKSRLYKKIAAVDEAASTPPPAGPGVPPAG